MTQRLKTAAILAATSLVLIVGAGMIRVGAVSGGGKPLPVNPDVGLTESEVLIRQAKARIAFEDHLAAWLATLDVDKLDLLKLPHAEQLAVVKPAAATFADAVKEASVVVTGRVTSITPQETGTIVTLSVDATLKGRATSSLSFIQGSTISPTLDWSGAIIVDSPGTQLLLPGTQGEFLLDDDGAAGLVLQEVAGAYVFDADLVRTQPANPFSPQLNGITRDALVDATKDAQN